MIIAIQPNNYHDVIEWCQENISSTTTYQAWFAARGDGWCVNRSLYYAAIVTIPDEFTSLFYIQFAEIVQ